MLCRSWLPVRLKLLHDLLRHLVWVRCRGPGEALAVADILVRDGDRNVFIGECKIFDPKNKQSVEHVVVSALDQLLGYLVWRDTKAALLLFIRDTNVSAVVSKALAAISSHPNHKRSGKISTEERHDFVLHAIGDTNREIHLTFLPFLIARKS